MIAYTKKVGDISVTYSVTETDLKRAISALKALVQESKTKEKD